MPTVTDQVIDTIAQKLGTIPLDTKFANNLYQSVPTDAADFKGLQMMKSRDIDSSTIKYTAFEPVKGLINSVIGGTKSPISPKRAYKTEEHKNLIFKDSVLLDDQDWLAILQAQAADARDAEKKFAAETVFRAVQDLKARNNITKEKLFWDGTRGTMAVPQVNNGIVSLNNILTNTRTLAALTSTAVWTDRTGSSTADPTADIKSMSESFTGKGAGLGTVYCNLQTFNNMVLTPALRDRFQYTTRIIEAENNGKIDIDGVSVEVYDASYNDANGDTQTFIPNGYIVGFAKQSVMLGGSPVEYIRGINVDSVGDGNSFNPKGVKGEYIRIKTDSDPVASQILFSNVGLPAFVNPQMIVTQQVY